MDESKRRFMLQGLFGAGWLGLRALATGLPIGLLADPHRAFADTPGCNAVKPQYLIFLTSGLGDPLNANVPGCYKDSGIYHPDDTLQPAMKASPMTIGGASYTAALPWTTLDPAILARTSFLHHATYTNAHGDAPKVNALMGATMRQQMLISMLAQNLAPCLKTIQSQPAVLSRNLITYNGAVLPILSPPALQAALVAPAGPLAQMQSLRDTDLGKLSTLFKQTGNKNASAMLDQYALTQAQTRSISQQLLSDLSAIVGSEIADLNIASAVLLKMNVSPVMVMTYPFGGDNHNDPQLTNESLDTVAAVAGIGALATKLKGYTLTDGSTLWDNTTLAFQNVFGRNLSTVAHQSNPDGRNHNADHHCTVLIGKAVKSSVIGGVTLNASATDYRAMGFDSSSGAPNDAGDIPYEATLGSVGKTIGAALGVAQTVLDTQITMGKVIPAALA